MIVAVPETPTLSNEEWGFHVHKKCRAIEISHSLQLTKERIAFARSIWRSKAFAAS